MKTILLIVLVTFAVAQQEVKPQIQQFNNPLLRQGSNQNQMPMPYQNSMPHRPVDAATEATHKRSAPQPNIETQVMDWIQVFSMKMMDPEFWLMFMAGVLIFVTHIVTLFFCIKKRNQRNKVKSEMKIRQMMFEEILIQNGMDRNMIKKRVQTIHI